MFNVIRQEVTAGRTSVCSGHWTLRIRVEPESEDVDPNICVFHKSAAYAADGKDTFYTVATLYDMETIPVIGTNEIEDEMPLMEQVPFYRTNEVTFVCPNADVADEIWETFKYRTRRLTREYEASERLSTAAEVSI